MKSARWLKFFLPFLAGALPTLAAPPASPAGMAYYEVGAVFPSRLFSNGILLNADGTFRVFYEAQAPNFDPSYAGHPQTLAANVTHRDGRWTYRVVDERTAEIDFGNNTFSSRRLTFGEGTGSAVVFTGTAAGGSPFRSGEFKLVAPTVRAPLVNSSNRSFVAAGKSALVGFVVTEARSRALVRAVGPGLRAFGVERPLARPTLQVASVHRVFMENSGWAADTKEADLIRRTSALVGAFPLAEDSADAAVIVTLGAGAYTARVTSATAESGEVLIEVYMLP